MEYYLNEVGTNRIIISSRPDLLDDLSPETISKRVIVELSINEKNEVLTHGRKVNTHQDVIQKAI